MYHTPSAFNDTVPADVQRVSPDDVVLTCGVVGGCSAKKLGDIDIPQHLREDVHDPKRKWTFDD